MISIASYYRSKKRRRRVSIPKTVRFLLVIAIVLIGYFIIRDLYPAQVKIQDINCYKLELYFKANQEYNVPWHYFYIFEEEKARNYKDWEQIQKDAELLSQEKDLNRALKRIGVGFTKEDMGKYPRRFNYMDSVLSDKVFPIKKGSEYTYINDWHAPRSYGGDRKHEGIDIMCEKGIPIVSVSHGKVEQMGWNTYGGWRIGIKGDDGIYYYYAHLHEYEDGLKKGDRVTKGQVIGYVGDSGYGPEGTTGKFAPHLHFGMYEKNKAVSPYPFLQVWENMMD